MRSVSKALRRSARPKKPLVHVFGESKIRATKPKFSIDWKFPVEFITPHDYHIVTALRDDCGVWTARNADGKITAYFGDEFVKHLARQIYAYSPGETPKRVSPFRKSGSIAERRFQHGFTDADGTFHCRD